MIINRTTVIIIPSVAIPKIYMRISWHPIGVYPSVTSSVIFPITGNPISAGIRNPCPITLYPHIFAMVVIPSPISVNPDIIESRRRCNRNINS
jgi:hypothetical protein